MTIFDDIAFRWRHFDVCSVGEWHSILTLRAKVFVVEQDCPYQDPDQTDPQCFHLQALAGQSLAGTVRAVPPGVSYPESSIGRVALHVDYRGRQLGRAMMTQAIAFNQGRWATPIRIGAQCYLQAFYESLGFAAVSAPYDEDGIMHLEMVRPHGTLSA